jgi:hypothetical protein
MSEAMSRAQTQSTQGSVNEFAVHFFLDFHSKAPYKGDTTALSEEWRES